MTDPTPLPRHVEAAAQFARDSHGVVGTAEALARALAAERARTLEEACGAMCPHCERERPKGGE